MLAERVVHAAVGDHAEPVGFGQMADAHPGAEPADPLHIRLQDVDEAIRRGEGEGLDPVPVLARGQCLRRQALPHVGVAAQVFGQHEVLQPLDPVGLQPL